MHGAFQTGVDAAESIITLAKEEAEAVVAKEEADALSGDDVGRQCYGSMAVPMEVGGVGETSERGLAPALPQAGVPAELARCLPPGGGSIRPQASVEGDGDWDTTL